MNKLDNHGPLYSDIEVLRELSGVLDVQIIDAEVPRNITKYVALRIILDSGRQVARLLLVASNVVKPCPHDAIMLEEAAQAKKEGRESFFTLDEILTRRQGQPLNVEDWKKEEEDEESEGTAVG